MPWKESVIMDERMKFIGRLLEGDKMAEVCREFGITRGIQSVSYPFHGRTVTVTDCGRICIRGKKINLSRVFAGQDVGVKEVNDQIWLVTFMDYDLGYFDEETRRLEPLAYPFAPEIV